MKTLPKITTWADFTANVENIRQSWACGHLTAFFGKHAVQGIVNENEAILSGVVGRTYIKPTARIVIWWAVK